MKVEQKEVIQQDPEQKEASAPASTPTESKEQDINAKILETLNSISSRISDLEEKTKEKETKVSEEDVYKSLKAQKEMMDSQFRGTQQVENIIISPEERHKQLIENINFSFNNGAYSPLELAHSKDDPYFAYSRNSYVFRKFFEQTGIKSRFENVEELTRYYTNKNKLNPISPY